jgi:hypothetical protein
MFGVLLISKAVSQKVILILPGDTLLWKGRGD